MCARVCAIVRGSVMRDRRVASSGAGARTRNRVAQGARLYRCSPHSVEGTRSAPCAISPPASVSSSRDPISCCPAVPPQRPPALEDASPVVVPAPCRAGPPPPRHPAATRRRQVSFCRLVAGRAASLGALCTGSRRSSWASRLGSGGRGVICRQVTGVER